MMNANQHINPTVRPALPCEPQDDALALNKAMKGMGTDEDSLINILARRNHAQRMGIAVYYKTMYGKELVCDLKDETSGHFREALMAMMTPLPEYYAKELNDSLRGLCTNEDVLIEVLATLSNWELTAVRNTYKKIYEKELEEDIIGDTSRTFKHQLVALNNAARDDCSLIDREKAAEDAQALYNAGQKRLGTNEDEFNRIFCAKSYSHLRIVFEEYKKLTKGDIENAIKSEFSGDAKQCLLAIARFAKSPALYFAIRIHNSFACVRTKHSQLIRLIVTRSEIDMADIKIHYKTKYKRDLGKDIKKRTSGDYQKLLLTLIAEK